MEKRAVIDEEVTPNDDPLPEYQQKLAEILRSEPERLEDLDENHPTRRLMKGAILKSKPHFTLVTPENK